MLSYVLFNLTIAGVYALLALALNLVWGSAGLVNLGLVGFFAIGAYATAIATTHGAPVLVGIATAIACGSLAGVIIAAVTLRLRDDYLAIVTLGFAEVVRLVALNERWLTRGADGISGIAAPFKDRLGPTGFNDAYFLFVGVIVLLAWLMLRRIDTGPFGRALKAVREDQELAAFAGKTVLRFKIQAFALSSGIAGFAGALYAHYQSYISPDHFDSLITIYIFLAVTAGGLGRPLGAVVGSLSVVFFLEVTRFLADMVPGVTPVQIAALRELMVGLALLLVLHLRPTGLLPAKNPLAPRPA